MGLATLFDTISAAYETMTKKTLSSFCYLETADPAGGLVAADGSMVSIIRVDGVRQLMGAKELSFVVDEMSLRLASYLNEPGHAIQIWFSRDPDLSADLLQQMNEPARVVARSLKLYNVDDLLNERVKHLSNFVVSEGFYMALWTRPAVLTKQELEAIRKNNKAPSAWPVTLDSQRFWVAARQIHVRHTAFVESIVSDLDRVSVRAEQLNSKDALRAIKASIYPDQIGSEWNPLIPGDRIPYRASEVGGLDQSHLFAPRLEDQLLDKEAETVNPRIVRVGRYNFGAVEMTVGPQEPRPFSYLLDRLRRTDEFPWRVSFLIEGAGLTGSLQIRNAFASILGLTNSENRMLRDSVKAVQEAQQNDVTIVKLRVSFATWAPSDDLNLIEERVSKLQRAVETWGHCGVSPNSGDPLAGVMSSNLGLDVASTAPAGAPPLPDVIRILPWNRDASPWDKGSVLFRTPDGRPWPYQPGSSKQDTFIDLISAPPGKGKSVFMNATNFALCLSPAATAGSGGAELPLISIIDIGPSSSGLISLLKEALPSNRRHEAQYRRLRMIREHAINPFDTQLGSRYPLTLERAFLVNFLTILGTPVGSKEPPMGLSDLAGMLVDEIYKKLDDKSRKGKAKRYSKGVDPVVDQVLEQHDIRTDRTTTWWSIVDTLFELGDIHTATLAQRYAVPLLEDLMSIIFDGQVTDIYDGARVGNGEKLLDVFQRMVSNALREYPILTVATRFDVGDSRIVALDLDEAAPRGGGPADKQTALVYMLARFTLAKDYYLNEELINEFPPLYQNYQAKRIRRIREVPKRIVFDEFHRTRSTPQIRDQVINDMREGRKWGVHIALISQLLNDFDDDMVDMATGVWIMGVSTDQGINQAKEMFGLSSAATEVIRSRLNGPGPEGAPFLAILNLKDGRHEHLLMNTLGPMELWAFSTTAEDVAIRNRLYSKIGPTEARARLAKRFPGGTAKKEIDKRVAILMEEGSADEEKKDGIVDQIVDEIITMDT